MEKGRIDRPRVLRILGIIVLILVAGACALAISTARYMKDILREQFNAQQLVLAKTTAQRIESNVQNTIADLILLNSLPAIQYCDTEAYEVLLLATLPVLNRSNVVEIRRVDRVGNTIFVANDQGIGMQHIGPVVQEVGAYLSWAADTANRGKSMGTTVHPRDPAKERKQLVLDFISPTYEESVDALHPHPSRGFAGYLKVTLNVSRMLEDIVEPIRSGKSGYAWVIDSSGNFVFHPEASFIGENAFDVRANRNPHISFAKINEIQREEMLKGKEGVGSYVSGWHREIVEPLEKLIAFSPVRIQGPFIEYAWSVAVVAPVEEIESFINTVYLRQSLLQGIIIFIILLGSLTVILYELRWSTMLEHEVAVKTNDISRYTDRLQRSEAKYRSLVESAEDLIFTIGREGMMLTANRHMSTLLEVDPQELVNQSLYRFLPREQVDEQLKLVAEALRSGKAKRAETVLRIQDRNFWFNIQYIPVRGEGGEHVLGIARDITERKALERQLINSEKLASLGTLAAGVAHEINNPIGIMLGFCDLLLEKIEPGTMEYNDLKTIERHGLHCKSIVERLLSFARISDETVGYCDVNANIEQIVSVVRHTLEMNKIELVCSLQEDLPLVRADCGGLQQVFLNLINNAVFAMNGQGVLTILTRPGRIEDTAEVMVSDTGCGIGREDLPKIFDPFFTTKKVGEGTGLGLSVSYGIITNCGGAIECESATAEDAPGQSGTTFTISLPVSKEDPS